MDFIPFLSDCESKQHLYALLHADLTIVKSKKCIYRERWV